MESENKVQIKFSVERELAEKFVLAAKLNKDNSVHVLKQLMIQYVRDSFSNASRDVSRSSVQGFNSNQGINFGEVQSSSAGNVHRNSNTKITSEMVKIAYEYAKKVYSGNLTRQEGKLAISKKTGMNPGSAQDYITCFLAMIEGREYHRTMSNLGTEYFLENIKKDFGERSFQLAIEATEKHIKYYNSLGYGQLKAKEDIVKKLKEAL
ncbi:hypothetical protein [Neobacillus kokaensis]|uniref:Uncharacterized protein n=1 Tax=Neobacillus kokaensis TaxID=2759023 RepID=A0ABQ3NBP8_9BACI|nr:hypothetical protein [Neobacillus kokaensis]GHI01357.1 hypothetical protein AM1BK_48990 [Neobacillus kokaensis]